MILSSEVLVSFFTLSILEIILGIDNLIFIALVVNNLPHNIAKKARLFGLILALIIRILMLLGASWIMSLTEPMFTVLNIDFSVKDSLLLAGGLFLIIKSTLEMHNDVTGNIEHTKQIKSKNNIYAAILQIAFIDFIFSFDSIITAIGLTQNIPVIVAAIIVSMIVMIVASGHVSSFLRNNPTFKVLALSFILMIGVLLVAESIHYHIERSYIYFSFGFSMLVETINTLVRRKEKQK